MSEPQEPTDSRAERKRKLEEVFGDVLPEQTSDDQTDGDGSAHDGSSRGDDWLRDEVPPHHG